MNHLASVEMWFNNFKEDLKKLPDGKGHMACCNIEWLIKEVGEKYGEVQDKNNWHESKKNV